MIQKLPEIFNETIIKLIMENINEIKSNNDLRPNSLTNFEYRIFTKVLANRFKKLSPYILEELNDSLNTIKDIYDAYLRKKELYVVSIGQK